MCSNLDWEIQNKEEIVKNILDTTFSEWDVLLFNKKGELLLIPYDDNQSDKIKMLNFIIWNRVYYVQPDDNTKENILEHLLEIEDIVNNKAVNIRNVREINRDPFSVDLTFRKKENKFFEVTAKIKDISAETIVKDDFDLDFLKNNFFKKVDYFTGIPWGDNKPKGRSAISFNEAISIRIGRRNEYRKIEFYLGEHSDKSDLRTKRHIYVEVPVTKIKRILFNDV
jgi:hypothetical protein